MRIGIDIQTTLGQKTGFGFYVENLVRELKKNKSRYSYSCLAPKTDHDFSAPERFLWDQIGVPIQASREHVDLLHQPTFSAPIIYNRPVVVTVHDLIAVHFGEDIPFWSRQYFARWMPFSYRFADHIIAVSNHTKKDIVNLLKVPEDKITVIYEAAEKMFTPINDKPALDKVREKYHLPLKFFLHVGTLNPRKNLEFLVTVYSEIAKKYPDYQLVIAGKKGWHYENLLLQVKRLGLENKINFIGYIDDEDKVAIYNAATLLVFPSVYEGFGLPPLEAMASGLPVVASNRSSIPEVVGDGGILADPTDVKSWVGAISSLIESPQKLRDLSAKGIKQAQRFSWEKTAQQTIDVYDKVLGKL